jgi:hypothetical protein
MQVLFENRRQARKIRWLTISFALWCLAWLYWAWVAFESHGVAPAEGGTLQNFSERLGVAMLIALGGILPLSGMAFYSSLYVTRIERADDSIMLTVLGAIRPAQHLYAISDLVPGTSDASRFDGRMPVNAPWLTLRVTDRKMPFVVDLQAEQADIAAIAGLSVRRG